MSTNAGFRILFVCTGNICRSPFAELFTRHLLDERFGCDAGPFHVASAGTRAVVGAPVHPDMRDELAARSLDDERAARFTARQLDAAAIGWADLVLGLTTEHRAFVVEELPRAMATAFTLRELARLCAVVDRAGLPTSPDERARALVARARLARPLAPPRGVDRDDVLDPMGLARQAHREAAEVIADAVCSVVDVLAGVAAGRPR